VDGRISQTNHQFPVATVLSEWQNEALTGFSGKPILTVLGAMVVQTGRSIALARWCFCVFIQW
jgi:hypothetical protein